MRTLFNTTRYAHLDNMRDTGYIYTPRSDIAREQHRTLRRGKAYRGARASRLRKPRVNRKQGNT